MLVKGNEGALLLVYRADRKVSWSKLRKLPVVGKKAAMFGEAEVLALGVRPGAVPPFPQLLGVAGVLDAKFREQERVAFNAGLQGRSMVLKTEDFPWDGAIADFSE
jgi:prolyl-tRNA editing enzyme YbaK/EbsC (Cys-tRNA(Pro) deacylase)